ncbi:protein of unknown function (plasmid) [Azospirillum baldaniorum]|uniref:Uncharacterized protein n=1 Tax=Azospirillum baldaniorum TaxID=1064539 RepID=A0A9P1NQ36_9PROT|nr:protein of unknown function [Azospirillum baldaniorum]
MNYAAVRNILVSLTPYWAFPP